jgi:hypothetical protein
MLTLDNVTTIYLTGFIALAFAVTQLILFRKKGFSAYLWAAGYLLMGLGYIVTLLNIANSLPHSWVAGPIGVLLGSLVILSSLGIWAGYTLPKKASLICLGGVALTATLFHFSRLFEAPLGSLEAILLAPVSATLIYSGWFAGVQAMQTRSKYIYLISGVFWVQGVFMALLTLGALAAKGGDYIIVTSEVVYWTSLINLAAVLIANISWSPNEQKIAFTNTTNKGVELWFINVISAEAKKITEDNLNANLGSPYNWMIDNETLLVKVLPKNRPALIDVKKDLPKGPTIMLSDGSKSQNRTYHQ